ncbi:MAG: radical SAM family heme chaperone HemW [Spirochaetes bacterium]|nr:radical SAM family heme chaperone HemW [Spirochaetota bacterium]
MVEVNDSGIYLHIPFCVKKCSYCAFYSLPKSEKTLLDSYTDALCSEINNDNYIDSSAVCSSVYFGGGTPSLLSDDNIINILESINNRYRLTNDCEITLECNPAQYEFKRFSRLVQNGINRFSMGIQTLNPQLHDYIGRTGKPVSCDLIESYLSIPALCGVDFITGIRDGYPALPDIERVIQYKPDHVSAYLLTLESDTALFKYADTKCLDIFQRKEYLEVSNFLKDNGYDHYEISNFAIKGAYSKHNLKYWNGCDYRGYGAGAHSYFRGERYFHDDDVCLYIDKKGANLRKDNRKPGDILVELVFTGLRTSKGVSEYNYNRITGKKFPEELCKRVQGLSELDCVVDNGWRRIYIKPVNFVDYDTIIYQLLEPFI